jgi:hypothetical protein
MEAASQINDELISCTSSTLLNQYHKKAIASLRWKLTIIFDRFAQSCTPASHRSVHKAGTPILACILRVFNRDSGFGILAPAIMLHKPIIACFKRSLLWFGARLAAKGFVATMHDGRHQWQKNECCCGKLYICNAFSRPCSYIESTLWLYPLNGPTSY